MPEEGDSIKITITDKDKHIVRTITTADMTKGPHEYSWDGKDDNGNTLPDGIYKIAVKATKPVNGTAKAGNLDVATAVVGRVTAINNENGTPYAVIGELAIPLGNIIKVSAPPVVTAGP
jgi:flagellar basal-body rod modification protein FlgD